MVIDKETMLNHLKNREIMMYEVGLIERLRCELYQGLPLSIIINSKYFCARRCHSMAFQLSRGMDDFKLIRGNINVYPIEDEANHSWVEKDGYVYDTTDGFKWKKEIYYKYFDAVPIEVYEKDNCLDVEFYQKELLKGKMQLDEMPTLLMLELIELLDSEEHSVNHNFLLEEIRVFRREKNLMDRLPKEIVLDFKKFYFDMMREIEEKVEKQLKKNK